MTCKKSWKVHLLELSKRTLDLKRKEKYERSHFSSDLWTQISKYLLISFLLRFPSFFTSEKKTVRVFTIDRMTMIAKVHQEEWFMNLWMGKFVKQYNKHRVAEITARGTMWWSNTKRKEEENKVKPSESGEIIWKQTVINENQEKPRRILSDFFLLLLRKSTCHCSRFISIQQQQFKRSTIGSFLKAQTSWKHKNQNIKNSFHYSEIIKTGL